MSEKKSMPARAIAEIELSIWRIDRSVKVVQARCDELKRRAEAKALAKIDALGKERRTLEAMLGAGKPPE